MEIPLISEIQRFSLQGGLWGVRCTVSGAREAVGQVLHMDDIVTEAVADKLFYKNGGGGISVSGGEPLLFPEFSVEVACILKVDEEVHVAIETTCFSK